MHLNSHYFLYCCWGIYNCVYTRFGIHDNIILSFFRTKTIFIMSSRFIKFSSVVYWLMELQYNSICFRSSQRRFTGIVFSKDNKIFLCMHYSELSLLCWLRRTTAKSLQVREMHKWKNIHTKFLNSNCNECIYKKLFKDYKLIMVC